MASVLNCKHAPNFKLVEVLDDYEGEALLARVREAKLNSDWYLPFRLYGTCNGSLKEGGFQLLLCKKYFQQGRRRNGDRNLKSKVTTNERKKTFITFEKQKLDHQLTMKSVKNEV